MESILEVLSGWDLYWKGAIIAYSLIVTILLGLRIFKLVQLGVLSNMISISVIASGLFLTVATINGFMLYCGLTADPTILNTEGEAFTNFGYTVAIYLSSNISHIFQ